MNMPLKQKEKRAVVASKVKSLPVTTLCGFNDFQMEVTRPVVTSKVWSLRVLPKCSTYLEYLTKAKPRDGRPAEGPPPAAAPSPADYPLVRLPRQHPASHGSLPNGRRAPALPSPAAAD